jgi:hypothetical protein
MATILEARVGFEPTNGGFADLSLRPLGYRAGVRKYSETGIHLSATARIETILNRWETQSNFRDLIHPAIELSDPNFMVGKLHRGAMRCFNATIQA